MKPRYLISACLIGAQTKYDGGSNYNERIVELFKLGACKTVCPEVLGGLPTPRSPSEIIKTSEEQLEIFNKQGKNVTKEFNDGANKALEAAEYFGIKKAILKSNSPSCGYKKVYDGTFQNKLVDGNGITTNLLLNSGFSIYSELDLPIYDAIIVCAGESSRCHIDYNKVFHNSQNSLVIEDAVTPFLYDYLCNKVIIVAKESEIPLFKSIFDTTKIEYAIGGSTREESVYNGLKLASCDYVLIHDGDRPYIDNDFIDYLVDNCQRNTDNVVPYLDEIDDTRNFVSNGKSIQTPQIYNRLKLTKVFEEEKENVSIYRDESAMYSKYYPVNYVKGLNKNKKLTFYKDLAEYEKTKKE